MNKLLRFLALLLTLVSLFVWAAAGANLGWTKTSVPVKTMDNVTGIEGIVYEKHFMPGIELLGGVLVAAGILAASSLLFQKKNTGTPNQP
jgi:hypothetical protein